jgi:6-phosphogluconolactonase
MSATSSRGLWIFLAGIALLALASCGGTKTAVCNIEAPRSAASTCTCGQCPAQALLIANDLDGHVATYQVQAGTVVGAPTLTTGSPQSLGMAVLNNAFVYQSNPTVEIAGAINGWSLTLPSGALTGIPGSPFSLGPLTLSGGLATSPVLPVLYVADSGGIDALQADATGALSPVAGSPFPSGTNLFLTVDSMNSFLFASDDDPPGSVSAFTIDGTSGALTQVPGSPFATTSNLGSNSQPGQIVVDQTGSFVYTVLTATGQIAGFAITPSSGALTPIPGSPFAAGNGPLGIATLSNFVYVSNATDGTISAYSITPGSGVLTPVPGSPFPIAAGALGTDGFGLLFASTAAGIRVFIIDFPAGTPSEAPGSPFPGPGASVLAWL